MEAIQTFLNYVTLFFIIYLVIYSTLLFFSVAIGTTELYQQKKMKHYQNKIRHEYYQAISIIVPAYNEEVTVVDTVTSLLNLDYKLYEIIVVDDGSKDNTSSVLIEHFDMKPIERPIRKQIPCKEEVFIYESPNQKVSLTLICKENGGKADALNMGINVSKYPYFVCMDSDSMLQEDALKNVIAPTLYNQNIVACGGLIKIANGVTLKDGKILKYNLPNKLLVFMQQLEYDRSFLAARLFWDKFNANLIISGAFGLFKKDIVIRVGGYDAETMGEDMELVVKLHVFCKVNRIPYQIKYVPDAVCWSQAPEKLGDLMKQRRRWHIGLFQTMMKYRQLFLNPRFGINSLIAYLYFLIYELFSPYIEILGVVMMILAYWVDLINFKYMVGFIITYIIFGMILSMTAFLARIYTQDTPIKIRDFFRAILASVLEIIGLRIVIAWVRVSALIGYKKKKSQWGQIQRYKMENTLEQ